MNFSFQFNPKLSFVVPVYNEEKHLEACLNSILTQTYSHIEVVLVDDGSTDSSPLICDCYAASDDRVKVIHQTNTGLSGARNAGLDVITGDYILFVDSDDEICPVLAERCCSVLQKEGFDVIQFKYEKMSEDGKTTWKYKESDLFPTDGVLSSHDALKELLSQHVHHFAPFRCVKSSFYREIHFSFPVGRVMEDMSTTYLVYGSARSICFLNEVLYYYRQRDTCSITSRWKWTNTKDANEALCGLVNYIHRHYSDLDNLACSYAVKFLIWCWMKTFDGSKDFINSREEGELKGWIHQYAAECREGIDLTNRLKIFLLDTGLLRYVARMAG